MNIEQLRLEKKRRKMTLQQIADLSGIPKRTVDDIFSGHTTNPRVNTLKAIENALGLSMERPAEKVNSNAEDRPVALSQEDKEILEIFSEIKRIKGEAYCKILIIILRGIIENK